MREKSLADWTRLAALAAGQAGRMTIRQALKAPFYRWRFGGATARELLLVPQDLRTADPSFASEIFHGYFGLAGAVAEISSGSPFDIDPPNQMWQRELHGFSWLRHFRAAGDEDTSHYVKTIIQDWIDHSQDLSDLAWEPEVTARRIISWLSYSPLILDDCPQADYDRVMRALTQQIRYLAGSASDASDGLPRLITLLAFIYVGLCVADQARLLENYLPPFVDELERQILADGGHVCRNPWTPIDLLFDLLPLKQCFIVREQPPPEVLINIIQRIMPMIRFLRLGDGHIGRFNGMSVTLPDEVATILAYDNDHVKRAGHAPDTGYCRLEQGETILLMDVGTPPPLAMSAEAHAGCLSFEMSSKTCPIIVNCGAPQPAEQKWRVQSRSTVAHSTLAIAGFSSSRLLQRPFLERRLGAPLLRGPTKVTAHLKYEKKDLEIRSSHNGYENGYGVIHHRNLRLSESGLSLRGEDQLILLSRFRISKGHQDVPFKVYFHIHPNIRVTCSENKEVIHLDLPNHECWGLSAKGFFPMIEESLFFADNGGTKKIVQISFTGNLDQSTRLNWLLERMEINSLRPQKIVQLV